MLNWNRCTYSGWQMFIVGIVLIHIDLNMFVDYWPKNCSVPWNGKNINCTTWLNPVNHNYVKILFFYWRITSLIYTLHVIHEKSIQFWSSIGTVEITWFTFCYRFSLQFSIHVQKSITLIHYWYNTALVTIFESDTIWCLHFQSSNYFAGIVPYLSL